MIMLKSNFAAEVYAQASSDIYEAVNRGLEFADGTCVPMFAFAVDTPAMPFAMDSACNLATAIVTGIRHLIQGGRTDVVLKIYRVGHYRVVDSVVGCDDSEHMLIASYPIAKYVEWYADNEEVSDDGLS